MLRTNLLALKKRLQRACLFTIAIITVHAMTMSAWIGAAETEQTVKTAVTAEQLASEALYHEVYGDTATRDRLLSQAIAIDPDYAPARWHLGYVRHNDQWVMANQLIEQNRDNAKLTKYQQLKQAAPETTGEHLSAANWCRKNDLFMQERGHLEAVVALEPDHAVARQRLGHNRVGNRWLTGNEIDAELEQLRQERENLYQWQKQLTRIGQRLHHENATYRKHAELELAAINDASAILPMELILSNIDEPTSQLVVETISGISGEEAALSLARHAVFSQWSKVRQAAALKLRNYDQLAWVPELLSSMETEVTNVRFAVPGANGRLYYRHVLFVETQDTKQTMINEVEYRRLAIAAGSRQATLDRVVADMNQEIAETDMAVRMRNMRTRDLNSRITSALTVATSNDLGQDPRQWWQWWNDENDVIVQEKGQLVDTRSRSVQFADVIQTGGGGGSTQIIGECLVAGTQIQTACGFKAVEKISAGDVVLSKDPVTGELAFKPVSRTTIRAAGNTVRFIAGQLEIYCSNGHPFWVSGEGWKMARELEEGMVLHTAEGVVPISSVSSGEKLETYNLVVADFHTYFVGHGRILSHDVTMREPVETSVPGMQH